MQPKGGYTCTPLQYPPWIRHWDIPVEFPFKPYPSQMVYMEKVIEALQEARVMCT